MSTIHRLSGAAFGTHFGDQVALVAVPLIAALAFDASPQGIGLLVACQSMAFLTGSIPFGIIVDRLQLRSLAIASAGLSGAGFAAATLSIGLESIIGFAAAITLAGFGVVLFSLTALSILPRAVPPGALARANAAIEVPRALCSFAVPLFIGLLVSRIPGSAIFSVACIGSVAALWCAVRLPRFPVAPHKRRSVIRDILKGGAYVLRQPLLLAISVCAVFWNLAFAALLVVLVPTIQTVYAFDPGAFGIALSAFGLAAVCGTWLAGRLASIVAPAVLLLFGPGSSAIAAAGLLVIEPDMSQLWLYVCFWFLGFGPSMWLVTQNSVRQLVTPSDMLGRVNAVIQTTIYGIRPLGALIGGVVSGGYGVKTGLALVALAFGLSFAASVFSQLRKVASFEALRPVGTEIASPQA